MSDTLPTRLRNRAYRLATRDFNGDGANLAIEAAKRIEELQSALDLALGWLVQYEPGDSRAVSDEFVSMAAVACDCSNTEGMAIIKRGIDALEDK